MALLSDVRELIQQAREGVARAIDSGLVMLYWHVGQRIRQDVLKEKRAEYGKKIVQSLAAQLEVEFGRGYGRSSLFNMVRFVEVFPDIQIVQSLIGQLSWPHFQKIIYLDGPLKRDFYAEMCRLENWNTRTLHQKIQSMLYERTAISKKPEALIRQELKQLREEDKLTPDLVFSRSLCVARQKRMQIDHRDYHLDLLFYHRKLRRLLAIDLKIGEFDAAYKGEMELTKRYRANAKEWLIVWGFRTINSGYA